MKILAKKPRPTHRSLLNGADGNIIRLQAQSNYTTFIFTAGQPQIMAYTIGLYYAILPNSFIKVSRSCIVNKNFIKNLNYQDQIITLTDNTEIQIARRLWATVKRNLNLINQAHL
jgi:DNA-binding LytR/AlgR family response regulator